MEIWKLHISLFGILFAAILLEVTIIPSIWPPVRVDFLIGMIIGQIIFLPFSQGFPFVILSALFLQAFSGAKLGFIPLLYLGVFLATDLLRNVIYLENMLTQIFVGMVFSVVLILVSSFMTGINVLNISPVSLGSSVVCTGLVCPFMVFIVGRLHLAYADEP